MKDPGRLARAARASAPTGKDASLNNLRNLGLWILIAVLLVFLFNLFQGTGHAHPGVRLSPIPNSTMK